jgi:2-keto-3-deoxy-L-rhamnonate aldolase RhmA
MLEHFHYAKGSNIRTAIGVNHSDMTRCGGFVEKLRKGELALGTVISFLDPAVTELMAEDLDFVWIDMEHSPQSLATLQGHLMATKGSNATPLVRVPWNDPVLIKPVLDCGAAGIIVPMVRTADDARQAVAACLYPPKGVRGYGPRRPSRYGRLGGPSFCQETNDEMICILQIEHIDAIPCIDAIVAVPGVIAWLTKSICIGSLLKSHGFNQHSANSRLVGCSSIIGEEVARYPGTTSRSSH